MAASIREVDEEGLVMKIDYHRSYKVVDDDDEQEDSDVKEVVILR